jgi:WD40 repeat protein
VREVAVAHPSSPVVLVKLLAGIVFTADREHGLRAWSSKQRETCSARKQFSGHSASPTSLSATGGRAPYETEICVGFEDGHFSVYGFSETNSTFVLRCSSTIAPRASITAIASSPPYIMLISDHKTMSLYEIPSEVTSEGETSEAPARLTSLVANSILAPMSLYLRKSGCELIASVAYSFYHIGCGWCIGIQEVHLASDGTPSRSRLVTTNDSFWEEDASQNSFCSLGTQESRASNISLKTGLHNFSPESSVHHNEPPTSLSYSHPYLITSHSDNTLTMYLVVSSADDLMIRGARRLWGHTSSVSTVQVSDRGKAVSVSTRGDEIRIWELETMIGSGNALRRAPKEETSVQVSPERRALMSPLEMRNTPQVVRWSRQHLLSDQTDSQLGTVNKQDWVGFDEEQVVLLRHQGRGTQLLECYDFT